MTATVDISANNPAVAIQEALSYLVINHAGVHWNEDFERRRTDFFSALASWDPNDSTYKKALDAAFVGVDVLHVQIAEAHFYDALQGASHKASKPKLKQRVQQAASSVRDALTS